MTIAALTDRLELAEQRHAAGLDEMSLNVLASPLQLVRDIFDLMPQDSEDDWRTFAVRMGTIPAALEGYQQSLLLGPRARPGLAATPGRSPAPSSRAT